MKKYPYSLGEAVSYAFVLTVSLWWIPVVGPMLIGYLTGRKAGGPIKGLIAMSVPIIAYFFAIYAIGVGWIHVPPIVSSYFSGSILGALGNEAIIPYIKQSTTVAISVGTNIEQYLYYAPPSFFIMFSFAFIGGAMSRQIILEKGIYPEIKRRIPLRRKSVTKKDIPQTSISGSAVRSSINNKVHHHTLPRKKACRQINSAEVPKKKNGIKGKMVIHVMDEPKPVMIKKKPKKKHGIVFL